MGTTKHLIGVLLIVMLFIAQSNFAQSQYRFQHYDTKDGLPDNYVWSIAQDSLGYMWFQYYGGLTRYDGYNFKVYKYDKDDSLRSALDFLLGGIFADENKNIWIAPQGHPPSSFILVRHDQKTDGFIKFTANLENNFINGFRLDNNSHTLWLSMGAGRGLLVLNMGTKEITKYLNPSPDKDTYTQQNSVRDSEDIGSSILLATIKGLWSFEKSTKTFRRPPCNPKDSTFVYHTPFNWIFKKKDNYFWTLVPNGIVKLGADFSVLQKFDFPPGFNRSSMAIDEEGIFWLGTWSEGLYRFNPADSSFFNIRNVPSDPLSLTSNSINKVIIDRDQNVWVATAKGVSKLHRKTLQSINQSINPASKGGPGETYKTKDKEFIVSSKITEELPLNSYEIHMAQILPGKVDPLPSQKLPTPPIKTVAISRFLQGKHNFWVATFPVGIFAYPINPNTEMIEKGPSLRFFHDPDNPDNTIRLTGIGDIWEDEQENLWVGAEGLHKVIPGIPYGEKGSVKIYKHLDADTNSISGNTVFQIYPENETSFWVLTNEGVDLFHRGTERFEHVFKNREMPATLIRTFDGTMFLGTMNGLYEATKERDHYRFDRLPLWERGEVRAIQEDRLGRLWLHSAIGLICYDRKEKIAIQFNEDDGLLHIRNINQGMLQQTSQGIMFTVDGGLTLFDPMTLMIDRKKTKPVLTKLEVNNKAPVMGTLSSGSDDFFMTTDISMLDELVLDYQHNNFTLEFSAMEMTAPEKNLYKHKLEGYDKDWIETDYRNRTTTYTNLDAGYYTFKVKASNHHGIWSDKEKTLLVKILPPPWKTTWAYAGYGLLFIGLLYGARRTVVQRERLKSNLKLAKVEQEKEHFELEKAKEVDKVKSSFFTNISHEFRTPLTLIKGPVQNLLEEFADNPKVKERLKLVERNSDLLLKLINQLLDLAKLESGSLKVEKSEGDVYSLVRAIASSFSSFASQKNISIDISVPADQYHSFFDKDKVETILINLINNAIKFTPANGKVSVRASISDNQMTLSVADTGIGIPLDQQSKIFERFHQVSDAHKEVGTGIGLALVKELINLMGGNISVKSKQGEGSEFTVVLPIEILHVVKDGDGYRLPVTGESLPATGDRQLETSIPQKDNDSTSKPHVLVVEDNADLRAFIIDSLGKEFHFLEAGDGRQGMEKAFEEVPDLIISDVMMPEMDGITMAGKIKSDIRSSHIPIILLTAKSSEDSMLSGLSSGADDYLTKPFNKNELLLKVRNRIASQAKIREKLKLELLKESPKVEVQSADEQFLHKVKEAILARLSDEQLSVESLAEEIGLSRSQLFRKITALTGVSVNELIRTFRLQKAAQLLEQNWGPVTQVAYEVGFSNLSYFSKVFKEEFGVLPSEYGAKI